MKFDPNNYPYEIEFGYRKLQLGYAKSDRCVALLIGKLPEPVGEDIIPKEQSDRTAIDCLISFKAEKDIDRLISELEILRRFMHGESPSGDHVEKIGSHEDIM